jgi:hypothetical protein
VMYMPLWKNASVHVHSVSQMVISQ